MCLPTGESGLFVLEVNYCFTNCGEGLCRIARKSNRRFLHSDLPLIVRHRPVREEPDTENDNIMSRDFSMHAQNRGGVSYLPRLPR